MIDYVQLTEEVRIFTEQNVKKSRYEHSVRVALMCARLCRRYGLDDKKGYFAGIAHDMCKDFSDEKLISLAEKDGLPIEEVERGKPALLHGRAAAVLLKSKFAVKDADILEAVANHTTGKIGMCDLAKCLFIADKIEEERPQSTQEYRERLFKMSLAEMFYTVLKENYDYILKKGYTVYAATEKMVEYYKHSF